MAFAEQDKVFVNFTGGLNTEATSLNFPEEAAQELDNFNLFITGEVKRRLGVDFEPAYTIRPDTFSSSNIESYAINNFEWKAVAGQGDLNFLGVQVGLKIFFHDLGAEPVSGTFRGSVDLSPFKVGGSAETRRLSVAYGEGVMVVANQEIDPVLIEFDEDTETFSVNRITIRIRDFEGIEEDTDTDFRPNTLNPVHEYNLRNQGWPRRTTVNRVPRGSRGVIRNVDPVSWTVQQLGFYPSNADLFFAAKAQAAQDAEVLGTYSPWALEHQSFGNTPAPRGHFVIDAFNQQRTAGSPFNQVTDKRPTAVEFYAGRIFYAGVPDHRYTGNIYFSQSLETAEDAGKCYQDHDPTAEDLNALLATDGGVIHIPDLGEVLGLINIGPNLVVVSNNGVWAISGSETNGNFQADSFAIRKISNEGALARESLVVAQGAVLWWGVGGISAASPNDVDGSLQVQSLTAGTIQTFYDSIPEKGKALCRVYHDTFSKKVFWLYNDTDGYDGESFRFRYNRALVLDLTLGSFYTITFADLDSNSPWIAGMSLKTPGSQTTVTYDIFHENDDVVEGSDDIVQDLSFEVFGEVKTKILTFVQNEDGTYSYTFSEFRDTSFHDWKTWDQEKNNISNEGASYVSVIQAGWNPVGDLLRDKTITHLTSFFTRTETGYEDTGDPNILQFTNPSGALIQVRWEFTDNDIGRWTSQHQAYRLRQSYIPEDSADPFTYGYTVVSSKLRMRGKGRAFSVRYLSEAGKDLQLLGFAVNVRAGAKV